MVRKKLGDVFADQFTLSDTNPKQPYKNSIPLAMCWIYTSTQNCYLGRLGFQPYLLATTASHSSTYALILANVDLADLWFKAATAGAVVTIIGMYLAEEEWVAGKEEE